MSRSALAFIFSLFIASQGFAANMTVSASPNSPALVPVGTAQIGTHLYYAPYFLVTSLPINSNDDRAGQITGITLHSINDDSVSCLITGKDLNQIFPELVDSKGRVILPGLAILPGGTIGCGNIQSIDRDANSYNIPVAVTVYLKMQNDKGEFVDNASMTSHITIR